MTNGNYQPHWHRKNRPERKSVSYPSILEKLIGLLWLKFVTTYFLRIACCLIWVAGWEWEWSHWNGRELVRKICSRTPLLFNMPIGMQTWASPRNHVKKAWLASNIPHVKVRFMRGTMSEFHPTLSISVQTGCHIKFSQLKIRSSAMHPSVKSSLTTW